MPPRKSGRSLTVLALATVLLLGLLPAPPARAAVSYTTWKCTVSGCKYGKSQLKYDRPIKYWYTTYWRGGTASQTCDPTNDITRWRMKEVRAVSGLTYTWGPQTWQTNCDVNAGPTWALTVNRFWSGGLDVSTTFEHDAACSGCDFTSVIWHFG